MIRDWKLIIIGFYFSQCSPNSGCWQICFVVGGLLSVLQVTSSGNVLWWKAKQISRVSNAVYQSYYLSPDCHSEAAPLRTATLATQVSALEFRNRVRKRAQGLRTLAALPEDPGLIPSTHMAAHISLQLQFQGIQWPLLLSRVMHACRTHKLTQPCITT